MGTNGFADDDGLLCLGGETGGMSDIGDMIFIKNDARLLLYCLACFLKMPPLGTQKPHAFSHENRCLERRSALESGSYHFPFFILPPIRITENNAK